ncbi:hypothetical protein F1847_07645 [Thermodesulfobacterium sp. TA1]|uniref:hypothetical protein n=1 Tax=Thermodesulfobacterium sp. TA1 TaxID=2234087 RepID=UPI0012324E11|nr:hypothetical protein [Thermodesulfobacterium sp. TA1]QER42618.1 hypothetical protein F1847_07645 [Thermodesulfobacterium sp. TA1]
MWTYKLRARLKGFFWDKLLVFSIIFLVSCAGKEPEIEKSSSKFLQTFYANETLKESSTSNSSNTKQTTYSLPKLSPIYTEVSPLENKILTLSFKDESFENVLYFLAKEAGLNLIISPEVYQNVPQEFRKISFQFKKQPLKNILEAILESLDLHYQIKKGVLYVVPFEEKVFSLSFLHVVQESDFNLGGDVLGGATNLGSSTGSSSGSSSASIGGSSLKGKYEIKGQIDKKQIDIYNQIESSLKDLISENGVYTLNRLTGTLYVKDRPSHIKAIYNFINDIKSKYKNQVIIEAKIVEVVLNKEHNLGIDWIEISNFPLGKNSVRFNEVTSRFSTKTNEPSLSLTITGSPNINLILNLLKQYGNINLLSNPRLRVIHGQPALISVGKSVEFVKEITRNLVSSQQTAQVQTNITTSAIFEGVMLAVTPYLTEEKEILLHIVPIKSDILSLKREDFGQDTSITLPEVNLREATSIIKVNPGDIIVLGGLILEKEINNEKKLVGVGDIPILGNIFKTNQKSKQKTELVIIIKVDIV